ncbi:Do family serine endopeptidase [Weeksellaceae bacterium A-14]|uniref:Do family serine endopeptidase n=1 Tax=Daejeonia sp. YH14 TaxID=3439042 RepID=UPI0031E4C26F
MKKTFIKSLIPYAFVGIVSGATTFGAIKTFDHTNNDSDFTYFAPKNNNAQFAGLSAAGAGDDFVKAAKMTVPAVVTIKNYQNQTNNRASDQDLFDYFFGNPFGNQQPRQRQKQAPDNMPSGLGSGVIISPEGYIITNNHVVKDASKLEVVLSNKKSYIATLVGTDPNTDIALLKIDEKGLPYLNFGNSDAVEVGQWVLAVGNPLGLNSTVTAGIISAKGRSINLLSQQSNTPIENFLQTDAAINPGNSGGALVDINGNLIGINSAISSNTGYYEGYGFAVPANLARKVVEDIKKFGLVQRAFLGIGYLDLSNERDVMAYNMQKNTKLKSGSGIYVTQISENGGAEDAGIKSGDIITKMDNTPIGGFSDMSFVVGSKRPGDKVTVTYLRNGKTYTTDVTLKDAKGNTKYRSKADLSVTEKIGAEFEPLSNRIKVDYGLESGVIVKNVVSGGMFDQRGITDNYIVMEVNGKAVNSQKDIEKILNGYKGNVSIKYVDSYGNIRTTGFAMPN